MEIKRFDNRASTINVYTHKSSEQKHKRISKKATKTVTIHPDMIREVYGWSGAQYVDSKVRNGTTFIPILVKHWGSSLLIDSTLQVYKITKRKDVLGYSIHCITKYICPHHHKKEPQVNFADGVLYCNRCKRVLNKDFESQSEQDMTTTTT